MKRLYFLLVTMLFSVAAFGQGAHYTNFVWMLAQDGTAHPVANATIRVCTSAATGTPCSPTATIYTDSTLTTPATNPFTTDAGGNYSFWAQPGFYTIQISGSEIQTYNDTWSQLSLPSTAAIVNFKTQNYIRYADQFSTTLDAFNDCTGNACLVVLPSNLSAGVTVIPDKVRVLDVRGNETAFRNDIVFRSRSTAVGSGLQQVPNLRLETDAYRGGHNLMPSDTKTQYASLWSHANYRTIGEHKDLYSDMWCLARGNCFGASLSVNDYGGYSTTDDESQIGLRVAANQGSSTSIPSGTISAINGVKVTVNWSGGSNAYLGEQRPLITTSRSVYETGTLSSATAGSPCTITGSGTGWQTAFGAGAHSDLFMEINSLSNANGVKYVIPVTSVTNNTTLVIEYSQPETGATCIGSSLTAGAAYRIFRGGLVSSMDDPSAGQSHPTAVNLAVTASMLQVGDTVQQPLAYNNRTVGANFVLNHQVGPSAGSGFGVGIENAGSVILDYGLRLKGKFTTGIKFTSNVGGTLLSSSGSPTTLFEDLNQASGSVNLFALRSSAGVARNVSFDRTSSYIKFGDSPFDIDVITGHISQGAAPQANRMIWSSWADTSVGGVGISAPDGVTASEPLLDVLVGGVAQFRSVNGSIFFNNGVEVKGYSGNLGMTQTWGIDSVAGALWFSKHCFNSAYTVCEFSGSTAPEGAVTALPGSTYRRTSGGSGTTLYVKESGTGNTGWVGYGASGGGGSVPYDLAGFQPGIPVLNDVVQRIVLTRAVTCPVNLAGSQGSVSVAAASFAQFSLQKNSVEFGTANFAVGSTTATFTAGSGVTFAAGDVYRIVSKQSDSTLSDPSITLACTR